MASYATKVKNDIQRWREAGLVDSGLAAHLAADIDERAARGLSFGSVLAILSALLFGASILIFVAANWEAFPRLFRVGLLFTIIIAGYVGGAMLKLRDHSGMSQAAYLVAGAAFGASIALIGQMYHLSGDERAAVLTWCVGVAVAAGLLRSGVSTAAAVLLAGAWLWMGAWDFWRDRPLELGYLGIVAALWALSLWTDSRLTRHLILLSLIAYAVLMYLRSDEVVILLLLAIASVALFLFAALRPAACERALRLGQGAEVHGFLGAATAMLFLQALVADNPGLFMLLAFASFAGIVAALMGAGRESRALRWLAYAFFGIELGYVYIETVGTMLGTAGFLLAPGILLAIMAFVVLRLERRLRAPRTVEGAVS
jgi:uncharacterized membrane protein